MTGALSVEDRGDGECVVRVEREWAGERAVGTAVVRGTGADDPAAAAHAALAESRAWLELGRRKLEAGEPREAVRCAEQGLEALGDEYAPPGVEDDTQLKLLAAQEQLRQGRDEAGARVMLRMLEERTTLYARRHSGEIVS